MRAVFPFMRATDTDRRKVRSENIRGDIYTHLQSAGPEVHRQFGVLLMQHLDENPKSGAQHLRYPLESTVWHDPKTVRMNDVPSDVAHVIAHASSQYLNHLDNPAQHHPHVTFGAPSTMHNVEGTFNPGDPVSVNWGTSTYYRNYVEPIFSSNSRISADTLLDLYSQANEDFDPRPYRVRAVPEFLTKEKSPKTVGRVLRRRVTGPTTAEELAAAARRKADEQAAGLMEAGAKDKILDDFRSSVSSLNDTRTPRTFADHLRISSGWARGLGFQSKDDLILKKPVLGNGNVKGPHSVEFAAKWFDTAFRHFLRQYEGKYTADQVLDAFKGEGDPKLKGLVFQAMRGHFNAVSHPGGMVSTPLREKFIEENGESFRPYVIAPDFGILSSPLTLARIIGDKTYHPEGFTHHRRGELHRIVDSMRGVDPNTPGFAQNLGHFLLDWNHYPSRRDSSIQTVSFGENKDGHRMENELPDPNRETEPDFRTAQIANFAAAAREIFDVYKEKMPDSMVKITAANGEDSDIHPVSKEKRIFAALNKGDGSSYDTAVKIINAMAKVLGYQTEDDADDLGPSTAPAENMEHIYDRLGHLFLGHNEANNYMAHILSGSFGVDPNVAGKTGRHSTIRLSEDEQNDVYHAFQWYYYNKRRGLNAMHLPSSEYPRPSEEPDRAYDDGEMDQSINRGRALVGKFLAHTMTKDDRRGVGGSMSPTTNRERPLRPFMDDVKLPKDFTSYVVDSGLMDRIGRVSPAFVDHEHIDGSEKMAKDIFWGLQAHAAETGEHTKYEPEDLKILVRSIANKQKSKHDLHLLLREKYKLSADIRKKIIDQALAGKAYGKHGISEFPDRPITERDYRAIARHLRSLPDELRKLLPGGILKYLHDTLEKGLSVKTLEPYLGYVPGLANILE